MTIGITNNHKNAGPAFGMRFSMAPEVITQTEKTFLDEYLRLGYNEQGATRRTSRDVSTLLKTLINHNANPNNHLVHPDIVEITGTSVLPEAKFEYTLKSKELQKAADGKETEPFHIEVHRTELMDLSEYAEKSSELQEKIEEQLPTKFTLERMAQKLDLKA